MSRLLSKNIGRRINTCSPHLILRLRQVKHPVLTRLRSILPDRFRGGSCPMAVAGTDACELGRIVDISSMTVTNSRQRQNH